MAKPTDIEKLSYEQAVLELEGIVKELEAEVGNLDQAIQLFERGQALAQHCAAILEQAELKVQELTGDGELQDWNEGN
ncbi:MAG TPA: exodeoxyribonuclease VII small subunit [Anaerolineales bacterium]